MASNITIPATGTGDATPKVATDQLGTGEHAQYVKLMDGTVGGTSKAAVDAHGLNVSMVASAQADGHSASIGSTTDAAATTTGSVIAQLRRIANLLAGTIGISGTVTANAGTGTLATSNAASSQADGHSASIGATTDAAATTTGSVIAQLRRVANLLAGTLTVSAASLPLPSGAATAAKQPALGTAGTPSTDVLTVQGASSGTALATTQTPSTSGGYLINRLLSAASTNATSVKASAGQVYGFYLYDSATYTVFLKLYNKASAPTVGTDTPVMTIPVPAGGGAVADFDGGIAFGTGIAFAVTKLIADTDTTVVAANDLAVNLLYK